MTTPTRQLTIPAGQDASQVEHDTTALLQTGWELDSEQAGVRKTYYFKTYTKALDFVQVVGIRSKSKNHHSVMTVRTGSVEIHWTTHHPRGLTDKDTFMARYCDERAREIGTVARAGGMKCGPGETGPETGGLAQ